MKSIFFLLLILCSAGIFAQHNDLKEYGLKGKVKMIVITQYDSIKQVSGTWQPDSSSRHVKFIYYYDTSGFVDSIHLEFKHSMRDAVIQTAKTINHFTNGIKTSYESSRGDQVYETAVITWGDAHTYGKKVYNALGALMGDYTILLTKNFRERGGEYKTYRDKGFASHETYENFMDENGLVKETKVKDHLTGRFYGRHFTHQKFDTNNNPCETISYVDGGSPRLTVRVISYY